jgi:serine/threonine protein kinase
MISGEVLGDKYKVERKIGQGGFASVYLGFDTKLQRDVAVKVLSTVTDNDDFKERFFRESQALANLNHPNILTVYDCGEHDGREYLVMELVNGPSLEHLIAKTELTMPQVVAIAVQICRAMEYAHAQGIIHRDLSLKNIMLDEEDTERARVKILDFGLVKLLYSGVQTTGNAMMGTPAYMAPEQVLGKATDGKVDVWAFGVGLYRILTGELPFRGEHPAALMYSIVNDTELEFGEAVPEILQSIVNSCLAKDAKERPGFGELAEELEDLQCSLNENSGGATTMLTNVSRLADRSSKRNPYLNRVMIKNPKDFFGREKEIRKIYSRLDAPQPQSISVVGDRRIGKSSLLNYVYQKKNRKTNMQNYDSSIFVYMDFQNTIDNDVTKYIDLLFNIFSFETGDVTKYTSRPKTLEQLKSVIAELSDEGKRIIIMMDEFELITRNKNFEEDFFSFLRSLANSHRVAYVTSSREELQMMCHNKDISDSPFFNIFSNLPLRPFSASEAMELIATPSKREGIPLEEYAGWILELAGLFPFFLQIACSSAFEYIVENPGSEPDWRAIKSTFEEEALPHYHFIWDKFDEMDKENIHKIAAGGAIGRKSQYVSEDLLRRGYLIESKDGLSLCSSSFADFVRRQPGGQGGRSKISSIFGRMKRGKGGDRNR